MDEDDIEDVPAEEEFGCSGVQIERIGPGIAAKAVDNHGHSKTKDDPREELCLFQSIIRPKSSTHTPQEP